MLKEYVNVVMFAGMKKALIPLLVTILLSACGSVSQRDSNYTPRIALEPTPKTMPGEKKDFLTTASAKLAAAQDGWVRTDFREVLFSDQHTGAYVADVIRVPITKYFRLVRPIECDKYAFYQILTPRVIAANKMSYVTGEFKGSEPYYACEEEYMERYADGHADMAGADGAIFDQQETKVPTKTLPFYPMVHIVVPGYAIKFGEPTDSEIREVLSKLPKDRIQLLQYQTVLYWMEKNGANQYLPYLSKILSSLSKRSVLGSPLKGVRLATLRTLAVMDPGSPESIEMFLQQFAHRHYGAYEGTNQMYAANVLACSGRKDLAPQIQQIAMERMSSNAQASGAAEALYMLGRADMIEMIAKKLEKDGQMASAHFARQIAQGKSLTPFSCPPKSPHIKAINGA